MPRRRRRKTGRFVFHVFNRAIQGMNLFEEPSDYEAFVRILREAAEERFSIRILAWVMMPNHWHLVVWPVGDDVSRFMQWVTGTHVRRWREVTGTRGRGALYQGRYKAIAVQRDGHFLRVCRYVERNPLRARLVARVEGWQWSSASPCSAEQGWLQLAAWPVPKPVNWLETLNLPEPPAALDEIRRSIRRGLPYGTVTWRAGTMAQLKWRSGARLPGRPRRLGTV